MKYPNIHNIHPFHVSVSYLRYISKLSTLNPAVFIYWHLKAYNLNFNFQTYNNLIFKFPARSLRYSCSLCPYKAAVPVNVKNHLRQTHRVPNTKLVPVDPLRGNSDVDQFLMMPKSSAPKAIRITNAAKSRDAFAPAEIDGIPKIAMFRSLIRCSVCDFVTKVLLQDVPSDCVPTYRLG